MTEQAAEKTGPRGSAGRAARIAVGGVALAALVWLARQAGGYVPAFAEWVDSLGFWGPLVFVLGYAAAVVAFVPGALLTLAGGAIFDLFWGSVYVFVAAVLGSSIAFLVARYLARHAVEQRLAGNPRFAALDRAIGDNGLKIMFLLRLSPAFPFSFLNYAIGLTGISFRDYLLASFGMIPGTILYVYAGKAIGEVAALASGAAPERGTGYYVVVGLGLAATVAVTLLVTRIARRALNEAAHLDAVESDAS
jgi:uncharacterized membrane protein YdjX (TVP38/TMEM64 family)